MANTQSVVLNWLHQRDMGGEDRRAVIDKIIFEGDAAKGAHLSRFVVLMVFSTAIATFGINADSTAVVIGAMLIAPLMIPIMATSASLLMGWPVRATRSLFLLGGGDRHRHRRLVDPVALLPRARSCHQLTDPRVEVSPTTVDLMIAFAAGRCRRLRHLTPRRCRLAARSRHCRGARAAADGDRDHARSR